MNRAAFIAIDWGTSNLRAWLMDADGLMMMEKAADASILKIETGSFEAAFKALTHEWLKMHGNLPVLMAGMIGSRQGWIEAPYQSCPATAATLAESLLSVPKISSKAFIVPGLQTQTTTGTPDVMRGEETQLLGALDLQGADEGWYCLPGTHSKWARIDNQAISDWTTHMTGEVLDLMVDHSILGRAMEGKRLNLDCFNTGVECAAQGIGLLHDMFSARSRYLFEEIAPTDLHSYLSGIVIGHEILSMLRCHETLQNICLVGQPALCKLYAAALRHHNINSTQLDGGMAVRQGLFAIYQHSV